MALELPDAAHVHQPRGPGQLLRPLLHLLLRHIQADGPRQLPGTVGHSTAIIELRAAGQSVGQHGGDPGSAQPKARVDAAHGLRSCAPSPQPPLPMRHQTGRLGKSRKRRTVTKKGNGDKKKRNGEIRFHLSHGRVPRPQLRLPPIPGTSRASSLPGPAPAGPEQSGARPVPALRRGKAAGENRTRCDLRLLSDSRFAPTPHCRPLRSAPSAAGPLQAKVQLRVPGLRPPRPPSGLSAQRGRAAPRSLTQPVPADALPGPNEQREPAPPAPLTLHGPPAAAGAAPLPDARGL